MILNISYRFIFLSLLAGAVFFFFPQIDLYVSSLFFNTSEKFYLEHSPWVRFIYHVAPLFSIAVGVGTVLAIVWMIIKKTDELFNIKKKVYIFIILFLFLVPGMLVNNGFKEFSGRARPRNVIEFNGSKEFTKIFVNKKQCDSNCSFVSGHSASGFFFCTLSLIFVGRRRKQLFWFGIFMGSLLGFVRIVAGGHFLSDVYFSFVVVYLFGLLLHYWMFKDDYRTDATE